MRSNRSEFVAHRGMAYQQPRPYTGPNRRVNRDCGLIVSVIRALKGIFA